MFLELLPSILWVFGYFYLIFIISLIKKDSSIVDIGWGFGFFSVALFTFVLKGNLNQTSLIALILVGLWGIRLSTYIFFRNRKKSEDFRYAKWRKEWKHFYLRTFLQVFTLQATIQFIVSIPVLVSIIYVKNSIGVLGLMAIIITITGIAIETVSDYQMSRFKGKIENKGKLIDVGLWKYSRHPNYFAESVVWFGLALFCQVVTGRMIGWISPIVMTFLLNFVSGVPLLERKYANRDDFKEYKRKTSRYIIWFPKK